MEFKNVIIWALLSVIIVFALSTDVHQVQGLKDVPASYILELIENETDIYFEDARIKEELDLGKIELKTINVTRPRYQIVDFGLKEELKIVESEIIIVNSVFEKDVDFSNTLFEKTVNFSSTTFSEMIDFRGARFSNDSGFGHTIFRSGANFRNASFSNDAEFNDSNFNGVAKFDDSNFNGNASFRDANFNGDALFWHTRFGGDVADFWDANFNDAAYFRGANFRGDAEFTCADFSGDLAFFQNASFSGDAKFKLAKFIDNVANFQDVNFTGSTILNYTQFNTVLFSDTHFTKVSLKDADFDSMQVNWGSLKDALVFNGPAYIKLIKNFREMEQFEVADDAYFKYRQLSQDKKKWSPSKLGDIFMWLSCGYGVKPLHTIGLGVAVILLFSLIYWRGNAIKRSEKITRKDNRVTFWDAFYFSTVTFTTVGFGDWCPVDRYRMLAMIEGFVGWLILALFLVTLANVMIRP